MEGADAAAVNAEDSPELGSRLREMSRFTGRRGAGLGVNDEKSRLPV